MICFVCFVFFLSSSMSYARFEGDPTKSTAPNLSKIKKITFTPGDLIVSDKGNGRWGIIDEANQNRMIFLHSKREYAEAALKVINHYGISEKYIINKWEFFVAPGNPHETVYPGEKSLSFDPKRVTIEKRDRPTKDQTKDPRSYWALMDGKKQIFDFGDDETAARAIFQAIIQEKGLNYICGAGGIISYWRKGSIDSTAQNKKMKEKELESKVSHKTELEKELERKIRRKMEWVKKCKEWNGKTFVQETANIIVEYPDFVDREATKKHAATLQRGFDKFMKLYSIQEDNLFRDGRKIRIRVVNLRTESNAFFEEINIEVIATDPDGPPNKTYWHEMVHSFQIAQYLRGRDYIFDRIDGMREAMAILFACYISDTMTHSDDDYCQESLSGRLDSANKERSLFYYESNKINPYTLDWSMHPKQKAGEPFRSGEWYFTQMMYRITGKYGWQIWPKYFALTADGGKLSIHKVKELGDLGGPIAKKAFAEFVDGLSKACSDDLRPQFRTWGFDL
jgi:hypothetical protein